MNSAYLSRLHLTSSSKRTCSVVVFGCFDGAFRSAKCFSSFRHSWCITTCITKCLLRFLHAGKHGPELLGAGAIPRNFGRLKAPKSGVAPAHPSVLPACICHLLPSRIYRSLKSLG